MLGFDWIGFVFRADDIAYDRAEYAGHSILHLTHELLCTILSNASIASIP